jgi:hypothetical protein
VAVPPALVQLPSQWPLALSITLYLSVNDKDSNKMKLVAVHISPGIYVRAKETTQ